MKDGRTLAVVPGSFDPITVGHIDIIRRSAELFDEVIVAVMINSSKDYMFSIEQRAAIAAEAVKAIQNVSVISSEGMLWELCRDLGADAIVKGYRNQKDYDYEMEMAKYNEEHYPDAKTVLLKSDPALEHISSTLVREKILSGADLQGLIPTAAIPKIAEIFRDNKIK